MRQVFLAALLVGLAAATVSCNQEAGGATGLALGNAPWSDGDRALYDWVDKSGNKAGTAEFAFARDGDAWVLSATDRLANLEQTAKVRVDAQTLKPLGGEKNIKAQGTDAKVSTTYEDGKLEIKAVVNGEDRSATIDVPPDAIDNDQLLATLRALAFAEGYEGRYTNVVGQSAAKIATTVRVKGKETVEVPAGSFEAWRVELDFGQAKQYAWYEVGAPHNLVQYDNGNIKLVLVE